uniref:synaptopodin-like n=1 Tax=Oncorhynchus gorbuscha TaxID=8017 RepID=UPI001EAEB055
METERGHMSVRRGVSWSPGGGRKPLQRVHGGNTDTGKRESDASSERRDYKAIKGQATSTSTNQLTRKTNLTRSASLSEKELKEARVRSQIIAAQLTVPSGCSNSRVQLFNRRKQRVDAFTLESSPPESWHNGFHSTQGSAGEIQNGGRASMSLSRQTPTIVNRTARPFFSPPTIQLKSPEARNPYNPAPTAAPVSQYLPPNPLVTQFIPSPTSPRANTFVPFTPQPIGQQNQQQPIKTGILEKGAAAIRRSSTARKSMFTFKEKSVMAPNPELLSLVQGNDDRKKHGLRSVPDSAPEEEVLVLGAEASNFLAKEEVKAEAANVPEWSSCLKSSRTREPRGQHQPEQTLTNASGKGAELFAKRQSRMEKYVVEKQNVSGGGGGQMRSPSPTASLPPSWIYPSNMPGRVKAIANNTDLSARLTRTLQTPQPGNRRPSQQASTPAPVPAEPTLEYGCTKIEMDLSRHQPYQLNSSLFIFNPVQNSTSTVLSALPRVPPPPPKPLISSEAYTRQVSLPSSNPQSHNYNSLPRFRPTMSPSLQPPSGGIRGGDNYPPQHGGTPQLRDPRITSPVSAFSPERVASPRPSIQAPRPTFSAKRAGIEPQVWRPSFFFYLYIYSVSPRFLLCFYSDQPREQQTYHALQEPREQQTYHALQEPREQQTYHALQESREQQTYHALQESREQQTYHALQEPREQQTYHALQESREQQTYHALQESREQQTYHALQ